MNLTEQIRTLIKYLIENNLTDCVDCANNFKVCECDNSDGEASAVAPGEVFESCVVIYSVPIEKRISSQILNNEGANFYYNSTTKVSELSWQISHRFKSNFDTNCSGDLRKLTNDKREQLKWQLEQFELLKLNENLAQVQLLFNLNNDFYCGQIDALIIEDIISNYSNERELTIGEVVIYFKTIHTEISNKNLNL
jgi:hypothetical protein